MSAKRSRTHDYKKWRDAYKDTDKHRKSAWAHYFESRNREFRLLKMVQALLVGTERDRSKDVHREAFAKLAALSLGDCTVCGNIMVVGNSMITPCGHMFHVACVEGKEVCPYCHKTLAPPQ